MDTLSLFQALLNLEPADAKELGGHINARLGDMADERRRAAKYKSEVNRLHAAGVKVADLARVEKDPVEREALERAAGKCFDIAYDMKTSDGARCLAEVEYLRNLRNSILERANR